MRRSAVFRGKWHSRPSATCPSLRASFGALGVLMALTLAATAGAAAPSTALPKARSANAPIVLALTATHPTSAALGSLSAHLPSIGLLSPAWLTLQPGGQFGYNASDPFTQGLTQRGARLVPVLSDPQRLAGDVLAHRAARHQLVLRLGVALRALNARGIVLDWRDLPLQARKTYPRFLHALRAELGDASQIVVTVPPVRTKRSLRRGSYDLRALSRPARLLVLAWNQHGPRSDPGPVASLAFWKQTLRTVLRVVPRSRVLMGVPTWGWQWHATAGAGAVRATQAQLFPKATEKAMQRRYGARVNAHAWVESDRSVQLKLLTARQAKIGGVALWVRGGESSATWTQPWLAPPASGR